jgi:two-component system, NtrC family, response regulator AtoC
MGQAILIIEDEAVLARNIALYLERGGYETRVAESAEAGLALLDEFRPDAVVLDFNLPGLDGLAALARIQAFDAAVRVVMITGHGNVELAVQAMKAGASDFLTKPVALSKLKLVLEKAFGDSRREGTLAYYRKRDAENTADGGMLGESPPMQELKHKIQQLLRAEARMTDVGAPAVLVLGETGSGKEVVARALHFNGPRRDKPFVELNCAAMPEHLLESELFGHERGAFTDARERKLGLVETAEGGTLFLDEIGDMDLGLQSKLLKLLEEKKVRRVGSLREQKVDVRIIAATHRPLEALVAEQAFRADLYYRLRVVQLVLPPLRERGDDILLLAQHFLQQLAQRYGTVTPALTKDAAQALLHHPWPGNVRELRNTLEQALLLLRGPTLGTDQLTLSKVDAVVAPQATAAVTTDAALGGGSGQATLPELERQALLQALERNGWNVTRAARALGISRDTLRYRIEKFQLER